VYVYVYICAIGTAYGVAASIQNICLSLVPLIVGYVKDEGGSDTHVEYIFTIAAIASLIIVIALQFVDTSYANGRLNSTMPDAAPPVVAAGVSNTGEWV
jgi:nitrate/nitrite transporter NarK